MLKEHLHMDISLAGWSVAAFEIAGIAGHARPPGWATDRLFGGRAPRTCVVCMSMAALCLAGFYALDRETPLAVAVAILMAAGFFIYGPQALVGIAAANIATKRPQPRRADSAGCSATEARSFRVGASGCSYSGPVGMRRFRR